MKRRNWIGRIAAMALCAGVMGACSGSSSPQVSTEQIAQTAMCPTRVAIFQRPPWVASCPAIPGWSAAPLFSPAATPSLASFCRYTWTGGGLPASSDFSALTGALQAATNSSNTADPDCPVVAALGLADLPELYEPMIETFHLQSGWAEKLPPAHSRVRVAVIDGAARPFWSNQEDTFGHGRAVGRVIDDLVCPNGEECAAEIRNYVALPLIDPQTASYEKGGYFGTRGQLAQAIVRAVDEWAADYAKAPFNVPPRLLLNLSVGWVPEHGGADQGKAPSPARAVLGALEHAACYGALTIAASGNHSGGVSNGPMLPGGWESVPAPTKCGLPYAKFPSPYPLWPEPGSYAPLVHAVTAVDATDRPSATTRPGGQSRLVAYGTNVVTTDFRAPGRTLILSGTSMATAIASGAAAAAWSYQPDWTSAEVMDAVYKTAVELAPGAPTGNRHTDFCFGGSCSGLPLRRVSLCNLVTEIAGAPECKTIEAHAGEPPMAAAELSDIFPMPTTDLGPACSLVMGTASSCGTEGNVHLFSPWVDPQPVVGCDSCGFMSPGDLYLDLVNPTRQWIQTITFVGYDAWFGVITAQRVLSPTGSLPYPEVFRVKVSIPAGMRSAELRFYIDDGSSRPFVHREPLQVF